MKKLYLALLLILAPLSVHAEKPSDFYFMHYEIMDLDFLRTHYFQIENGRAIQFEATFQSLKWLEPFAYKERLNLIGFDSDKYNLLQFSLKEKDDYHYTFPILMFHSLAGDLQELKDLVPEDHLIIYGRFYNLKKADFAIEVDLIDRVSEPKGFNKIEQREHDQVTLLDARVSPSPTPTGTPTPTPGPSVWQKLNTMVNPPVTATPTGTITPETTE